MYLFRLSTLVVNKELFAHQKRSLDVVNSGMICGFTELLIRAALVKPDTVAEPTHLVRSGVDRYPYSRGTSHEGKI